MKPGDRVEFTEKAKQRFPKTRCTTGIYIGTGKKYAGAIIVHRDGVKWRYTWHESFWQKHGGTNGK